MEYPISVRILAGLVTTLGFFSAFMLEHFGEDNRYRITINLAVFLLSGLSGFVITEAFLDAARQRGDVAVMQYSLLLSVMGFGLGSAILPYIKEFVLVHVIFKLKSVKLQLEFEYEKQKIDFENKLRKLRVELGDESQDNESCKHETITHCPYIEKANE